MKNKLTAMETFVGAGGSYLGLKKAGVISKKIEGNPIDPEKLEKEKKVAEKEEADKAEATPPSKKN